MIHYIGKVLKIGMSPLEIVLYSLVALIITGFLFKWLIYDKFIKPKKKAKKVKLPDEEDEE